MNLPINASDSSEQRAAEVIARDLLSKELGFSLQDAMFVLDAAGLAAIQIDACNIDHDVYIEIYAGTSVIKGGQWHKIMADALKLLALEKAYGKPCRKAICFVDPAILACFKTSKWRLETLTSFGIELLCPAIPQEALARLRIAKKRQGGFGAIAPR